MINNILRVFFSSKNSKVFFDININGKKEGRMVFELFNDVVPKTSANFYHLCIGDKLNAS
jgi:peptidyl-prolyl isomerase D